MKRYIDYLHDYEKIVCQGMKEGKGNFVKPEFYVAMNFIEDNHLGEPWNKDFADKLEIVLKKCNSEDRLYFTNAICETIKAVKGI